MNLIFIWIEEYKKLRNFQTNFGCKHLIEFENKKIFVKMNKQFNKDFFSLGQSEVTIQMSAIVGENGTGKSTVLDFIIEYIQKGKFKKGFIIVFEEMDKIYIDTNIDVKIEDKENIVVLKDEPLDSVLENVIPIFFSNVFDARYFKNRNRYLEIEGGMSDIGNPRLNNMPKIKNITTNELLATYENPASVLDLDSTNQIFFSNEYLNTLEMDKILELPNKIFVKNGQSYMDLSHFSEEFEGFVNDFSAEKVAAMHFNIQTDNELIDMFVSDVLKHYCVDVANILRRYPELNEELIEEAFFYTSSNDDNLIKIIYKGIIEHLILLQMDGLSEIKSKLKDISSKYIAILNYVQKLEVHKDLSGTYYLINDRVTSEFIKCYRENFYSKGLISLHWSHISSGQLSLLNLFGRFYNALYEVEEDLLWDLKEWEKEEFLEKLPKEIVVSKLKNYNYLLLLDECDLYFHPQWQKDWLYYFLKLIEILFVGNVQVILTTHSPFVLSDFPNNNVTFLSKNSMLNNDLEGSVRTFGANINELFTNSFFINDGLMGKFAKDKINKFIRELLNSAPIEVEFNKEKYRQFIDLIGEPLIKNKLLQIYNEKLDLAANNSIEQRIMYLESELKKLKDRGNIND